MALSVYGFGDSTVTYHLPTCGSSCKVCKFPTVFNRLFMALMTSFLPAKTHSVVVNTRSVNGFECLQRDTVPSLSRKRMSTFGESHPGG